MLGKISIVAIQKKIEYEINYIYIIWKRLRGKENAGECSAGDSGMT